MSVIETERTGKISDFYDEDTGVITEDQTNKPFDFAQQGAQMDFKKGDSVWFITITTPSGRTIVKRVGKPA
jgi:acid phosphatase class B